MIEIPTFTDAAGREWRLVLNLGMARRIRDELGVDFGQWSAGTPWLKMATDPFLFGAVLYSMCESQAQRMDVTPEEFGEAITGEVAEAARQALDEAVVLFSPAPMRPAMQKMLTGAKQTLEQGLTRVADKTLEQMPRVLAKVDQMAEREWNAAFGKSSRN
jgi:hypothetical protein